MNALQRGVADGVIQSGGFVAGHLLGGIPGGFVGAAAGVGVVMVARRMDDRAATEEVTA